jgi:hypothetical protein
MSGDETFKVSSLLNHLKKQNIDVKSIYAFEGKVVFLLLSYKDYGMEIFLYIPSKYNILAEKSIGLPLYEMGMDDDEESSNKNDSIFVSETISSAVRKDRKDKINSLSRFQPVLVEQPYKMLYLDSYYMVYIDRRNEIASFILSSPPLVKGYYFVTDMEYFLKAGSGSKIWNEIRLREKALCDTVYHKLKTTMIDNRATLALLQQKLRDLNPELTRQQFHLRMSKCEKLIQQKGSNEGLVNIMNQLRSDNFSQMMEMEKIIYILNHLRMHK